MGSAWHLLDLTPTADERAIRRAYARRLKLTRPDEDPAGFQRLVAARDWALAKARRGPLPGVDEDSVDEAPEETALPKDRAPWDAIDGTVSTPTDAIPSVEPPGDGPLVREPPERVPNPPAADEVPPPLVIDVAPLEAGPADWAAAERLALALPPLAQDPAGAFAGWIEGVRRLPHGPRRLAEVALIGALFTAWRDRNGRPTWTCVEATRPALLAAAPVFGWPQEDAALAASLPPADAALAAQILRDALPPSPDDRAAPLVPVGLRTRLPLHAADAGAFFQPHHPGYLAYDAMRDGRSPPRRFSGLALAAPHVWALARKRWGVALLALAGLWLSYGFALLAVEQSLTFVVAVLACLSVATWTGTAVTVARFADRILIAGAARAARRAARKSLFAPAERAAWLCRKGAIMALTSWGAIIFFGAMVFLMPYATPFMLVGLVLDRLAR